MADTATLKIDGKTYRVDDLTLNEMIALEDACDAPLEQIDFSRPRVLREVVLIFLRRDDPGVTFEEAGAIKISALAQNGNGAKGAGRS